MIFYIKKCEIFIHPGRSFRIPTWKHTGEIELSGLCYCDLFGDRRSAALVNKMNAEHVWKMIFIAVGPILGPARGAFFYVYINPNQVAYDNLHCTFSSNSQYSIFEDICIYFIYGEKPTWRVVA